LTGVAQQIPLPKWGLTMEEGTIVEWVAQPGEQVSEGSVLARVETEKIEVDMQSPVAGIVAAHLAPVGTTVPIGHPVVVIAADQDDYLAYRSAEAR
jgi:pyruvate/2-oxoglutarate dehydrogenase complex dihydrolipoamide acyltransferase (E2) component